jgi:phosphatidyl-myo-inositol dimannoside synthase
VSPAPRILALTPVFPPERGGLELLAHRLLTHLRSSRVRVVSLDRPGACEFDRADPLDIRRTGVAIGDRHALKRLNAFALGQALRFRPHLILNLHATCAPAALAARALLGAPILQYAYAKEFAAFPRLAARAVRRADAVVGISGHSCRLALDAGAPPDRVHQIPPGVDLPAEARSAPDAAPTLVTVARLDEAYKGHDVVLRALPLIRAQVPAARWIVIGDGPLRGRLERDAATAGLGESVRILGAVSDLERDAWLERANVFVMPSRIPPGGAGGEGFGIVYLEAHARGLPVVAGDVAGVRDAVVAGRTALLVDPSDHRAVAAAVVRLLLDGAEARRMGRAGREYALRFAWPVVAREVEGLAHALASGSRPSGSRR